jgi:hypothetical protein
MKSNPRLFQSSLSRRTIVVIPAIPALKGWAKFITTLRVGFPDCEKLD